MRARKCPDLKLKKGGCNARFNPAALQGRTEAGFQSTRPYGCEGMRELELSSLQFQSTLVRA